jgi:hypothetical protein
MSKFYANPIYLSNNNSLQFIRRRRRAVAAQTVKFSDTYNRRQTLPV